MSVLYFSCPPDSSRRRFSMSRYIPDNQKHLTLDDRKIIPCDVKCASCPTCNQTCPDFVSERCSRLNKTPYVCNGCPKAIKPLHPLPANTAMMLNSLTGSTESSLRIPAPVSAWRNMNCGRRICSSPHCSPRGNPFPKP